MKGLLLICSASVLAIASTVAHAQETLPSSAADQSVSQDLAPGDIVVTATRNSTLASKTPVALTAIGGDALLAAGVTNPTALSEQVPNLAITRGNGLQITIRGVTSSDGSEKGDPSAAFMNDGIYIARPQAQEVSFFDIDRVEVLRGPQGTLFGRNTTAGLVNLITRHPVDRFEASVDAAYGNYDTRQVTGMVNVPLSSAIAVRAAVNYDYRGSYLKAGPQVTAPLGPFKDNISGRLSASFDMGPAKLLLIGDYSSIQGRNLNSVLATNIYTDYNTSGIDPLYIASDNDPSRRTVYAPLATDTSRDNQTYGILADFSYDFGAVQLNYLGSYRKFDRHENLTLTPGSGATVYSTRTDAGYEQTSNELRLSTTGDGPLKAQAGIYYFDESGFQNYYIFGLLSPTPATRGYVYGFPQRDVSAKSLAGFGQLTYRLTDSLRVTAGIRYSRDDKARTGGTVVCATTACTSATDTVSPNDAKRRFSKTTWRAGVDYDVNSRTLLYGVVSTGYKAGGFNDGCQIGTGTNCTVAENALYFKPETLTSYEAGLKTRLLDDAVRLNLAVFHYDYNDIQLSQLSTICGGPCTVTTNAGKAKVDGVELEGTITPQKNTRFDFSASWLNARYTEFFPTPTVSWAGKALDRSPDWTVTAGLTQTFDVGNGGDVQASVRTRLSSSYVMAALGTLNQFRQPSYTSSDVTLTYNAPDRRWYVQGFIRNIEDNVVVTGAASGTFANVVLGDPRTFGGRIGFKF